LISEDLKPVADIRIERLNQRSPNPRGSYVLYWMIAARRTRANFGLQHAIWHARHNGLPLIILEPLRIGYEWAADRHHRFIIEGMADQRARLDDTPIAYHAYVERVAGDGSGLLAAFAADAAVIVTDSYPAFFLPRMLKAAAARMPVLCEAVDSNGLLPLRSVDRTFTAAVHFRRHMQKNILPWLQPEVLPMADPLEAARGLPPAVIPEVVRERWPEVTTDELGDGLDALIASLPIDHSVPAIEVAGGEAQGRRLLDAFVGRKLKNYAELKNEPELDVVSGLSPYLHFGHIGVHTIFTAITDAEGWHPSRVAPKVTASRAGWWGMSPTAEAFIDQLVTWRELGFNECLMNPDHYDKWTGLPEWARKTLDAHAGDERAYVYTYDELEGAQTHDDLWNAAQRQLREEGVIHNYLRMLWGKKVIEWSPSPQIAFERLLQLNNRWSVDGRDPNSYTGVAWIFGRFDRPWGPERPIFGSIRYMSSDNTAKKVKVKEYLRRWGPQKTLI